jgi:II/X family phage/plasmid replication protein
MFVYFTIQINVLDRFSNALFFIDRLFMQQDHLNGGLPIVGQHKIERMDLETGEKLPPSVNQKILEGSFSTKLTIRSDGQRVRVEGNPSRWQRTDNLFGLATIDECVSVYNHILSQYGLPPFTQSTHVFHRQTLSDRSELRGNGAEITGIDFTVNHEVGKGKEQSFIRGMSSMQIGRGRQPKLYPDGNTCNWGEGSTWLMTKLYCKSAELHRNLKKIKRKKYTEHTESQLDYINRLIEYCQEKGVVREEHSLRQAMLKRHNLHIYGLHTELDYFQYLKDIENAMNTIQISHDEHESIAHQLFKAGAVKTLRQANSTMAYCNMWQNGTDLRHSGILSQSQFYEHKARLKIIGIDIGQNFDVSRICPTLRRSEVIYLKPLEIPSWYRMPNVSETNVIPFKSYA